MLKPASRRAHARVASAAVAVKGLGFASMNALESGAPLTRLPPPLCLLPALEKVSASAVGFAAEFYGEHQDGITEIMKADAVVVDGRWRK
jgi:hypothetical protein